MSDAIAIIGMACRLPGATDPDAFWRLLTSGRDAFTNLDEGALRAAGLSAASLADPAYVRRAPILTGIDLFDAGFFGLSAEQADLLDPQHRLFFECAWEAMARAGRPPRQAGRDAGDERVGVFAGCSISSYLLFNLLPGMQTGASASTLLSMIGNDKDYLASHLAYLLGLRGPSIGVQTACSTSLVAVHLACQSLLSGECDMALAGGVTVRVPHAVGYRYEPGSILSPTGQCRCFDAGADGTVFGSGAGVVLLKRLDAARRDGDPVLASILGSAVNNDADRKAGYTAPSVDGQAAVIAEALAVAGVAPDSIGYIEAHATATPIGDPIEVRALSRCFPVNRSGRGRIALGSAKSAIGHVEAAAGIAGLIAAVQALRHATIPALAHFSTPNPVLNIQDTAFDLRAAPRSWPDIPGPRRAGVSSFGIGGTNAHVVLEQAPVATSPRPVTLPFQRRRHWRDVARPTASWPGRRIDTALTDALYEVQITPADPPWLIQHVVCGQVLFPAAGFAALALSVAGGDRLGPMEISNPLPVPAVGVTLHSARHGDGRVTIHARTGDGRWTLHAAAAPVGTGLAGPSAPLPPLSRSVDADALYADMAAAGIELGPEFRRLRDIRAGDGIASAALRLDGPLTCVLDGLLHLAGAALSVGQAAHLPVGFDGLYVAANLPANGTAQARLRPTPAGPGIIADLTVTGVDGRLLIALDGLVSRPARAAANMLYQPVWVPVGTGLPAPMQVFSDIDLSDYRDYLPRMDRLAAAYVAAACGDGFRPGQPLRLPPSIPLYERLLPRLRAMVVAEGLVDGAGIVQTVPDSPATLLAELLRRCPAQGRETGMLARCGAALADLLSGRADPLALLFATDAGDGAAQVYAESPYASALNGMAGSTLSAALAKGASGLRVVEIGGGTGGTTRHLWPILRDAGAVYHFTDISPAFLADGAKAFDGVTTAVLDIDRDPAAQGFAAGSADLVVAANVLHATPDLARAVRHAAGLLAPGGWLLLIEGLCPSRWLDLTFALTKGWWAGTDRDLRPDYPLLDAAGWTRLLGDLGLSDIAIVTPGPGRLGEQAMILARRPALVMPVLETGDLLTLMQTLGRTDGPVLLPMKQAQAALRGIACVAAVERPGLSPRIVDMDRYDPDPACTQMLEAAIHDGETLVAWADGQRSALRLKPWTPPAPLPEIFTVPVPAGDDLDAVMPVAGAMPVPAPGQVVIAIRAAGLNFKDVLVALGQVPGLALGGECAGTIVAVGSGVTDRSVGDDVLALAGGSLASHVAVSADRTIIMPPGLAFAQAAAIPVAGFTVHHALVDLARVRLGDRVLIHAASGGVGQFACSLVRHLGGIVVATAGSARKRQFLRAQGIEHVFDSRAPGWADAIRACLGGVDVVLNSLTGHAIPAGLSLLPPGGRFLELGRTEIWSADQVAARFRHVEYHVVELDRVDDATGGALLRNAVQAVTQGRMDIPPLTILPLADPAAALRRMAKARHLGKVVLVPPRHFRWRGDAPYLITGGLGGIGLALAERAVARGARHLVLVARRPAGDEQAAALAALRDSGARVDLHIADVADRAALGGILADLPPLAGIFHAAGTLDDAPLADQNAGRLGRVWAPKVDAARHLDDLAGDVDCFVLFSSAGALLGSPLQANHAAACAALDALALDRRARGRHGLSIAWGAWGQVGAARRLGVAERMAGTGMGTIDTVAGLDALEAALHGDAAWLAALPIDWSALTRHFNGTLPPLLRAAAPVTAKAAPAPAQVIADLPASLRALAPAHRVAYMADRVAALAASLLSGGTATLSPDRPLQESGLDSLLSVELRNRLGTLVGASLPATLLFNYPTINALAAHLLALVMGDATMAESSPSVPATDEEIILTFDEFDPPVPEGDGDDFADLLRDLEQKHG